MKKVLREIYRNIMAIISQFSPLLTSEIYYFTKFHKKINLEKPKTFNEKLMWLKLNDYPYNNLITKCADKYKVREYVKQSGCEEILNNLIAVYDNVDEIDFEKLPDKFVLKCNHAAGYNIICDNKENLDINDTKMKLKKWLKTDYWKYVAELQYKNIDKKIICEDFLESNDKNAIEDYKIYCFNGKPLFCMICKERNTEKTKYYFMDRNWKLMKINKSVCKNENIKMIKKPKFIEKMYEYAEKLSKPFKFVRVDLYEYKEKIIFGELTFTPAGCIDNNYTDKAQIELGKMIKI